MQEILSKLLVNTAASIIGESGQEIVGDTIGLSRNGFVSLLSVIKTNWL